MAHIQISQESAKGPLKVVIDGVDMSRNIYTDGFALVRVQDPGGDPLFDEWGVQMVVAADALDIDLSHAVLQAIVKSDEEMQEASA